MTPNTIFTYGTLQLPDIQMHLIGRVPEMREANLQGYEMQSAYGGNYLALVPGEDTIEGKVFDVNDEELAALDKYEGAEYIREIAETAEGEQTFVYVLRPDLRS